VAFAFDEYRPMHTLSKRGFEVSDSRSPCELDTFIAKASENVRILDSVFICALGRKGHDHAFGVHFEAKAGLRKQVEELHGRSSELEGGLKTSVVVARRHVTPEIEEPAHQGRVESRANPERTIGPQQPSQ
jgi:hypothetical protein